MDVTLCVIWCWGTMENTRTWMETGQYSQKDIHRYFKNTHHDDFGIWEVKQLKSSFLKFLPRNMSECSQSSSHYKWNLYINLLLELTIFSNLGHCHTSSGNWPAWLVMWQTARDQFDGPVLCVRKIKTDSGVTLCNGARGSEWNRFPWWGYFRHNPTYSRL